MIHEGPEGTIGHEDLDDAVLQPTVDSWKPQGETLALDQQGVERLRDEIAAQAKAACIS